ncbi:tyrosine-type recombinase/integrase [Mesorhizobium sp. M0701]|uniref:tyrosine-type recombinase/integrase n=1 Tax=Mesorhizobium sp. M0701 TaxID=2956989 RepID=UPI003335384B
MTMLVGLLASTGLRSGEALRLDRADVDLVDGVLHIRRTKFRKESPGHAGGATNYSRHRDAAFPTPKDVAFFLRSRRNRLSKTGLNVVFRAACNLARLNSDKALVAK